MIDEVVEAPRPAVRSWLRCGILVELLGACLLLAASRYAETYWARAFGQPVALGPGALGRWLPVTLLAVGLAAMVVGYATSLRAIGRLEPHERPGLQAILLLACLLALPLMVLITIPSNDLYHYTFFGRIEVLHHANPYTDPPNTFKTDPFLPLLGDQQAVSVYGPVWQLVASAIVAAAGPAATPALFVLIFKSLGLLTLLGGAALIWAILGRLAPDDRARGAWLYAANPLCLIELAGSGHNDGLMMLLVLLAVLVQLRGRTVAALICLGLAVLVKWIALLVLPAYLVWAYTARRLRGRVTRDLLAGVVIVAALAAGLYGRHWAGTKTFGAITGGVAATRLRYSLASWTVFHLDRGTDRQLSDVDEIRSQVRKPRAPGPIRRLRPLERRVKWGFSLLFAAWATGLLVYVRGTREMLRVWGWTLLAYVCLASTWFWPWYLVWVLALAALAPGTLLARTSLLLSTTALVLLLGRAISPALGHDPVDLPLFIFLPPLAYGLAGYLRRLRQPRIAVAQLGPLLSRK